MTHWISNTQALNYYEHNKLQNDYYLNPICKTICKTMFYATHKYHNWGSNLLARRSYRGNEVSLSVFRVLFGDIWSNTFSSVWIMILILWIYLKSKENSIFFSFFSYFFFTSCSARRLPNLTVGNRPQEVEPRHIPRAWVCQPSEARPHVASRRPLLRPGNRQIMMEKKRKTRKQNKIT